MRRQAWIRAAVAVSLLLAFCAAAEIEIPMSVVGTGGGEMSGANDVVTGTVGQPAIGTAAGGSYANEIGFWYQPGWILTDVPEATVPGAYEFHQNYPNPFNPLTTFRFALPERSAVRLTL